MIKHRFCHVFSILLTLNVWMQVSEGGTRSVLILPSLNSNTNQEFLITLGEELVTRGHEVTLLEFSHSDKAPRRASTINIIDIPLVGNEAESCPGVIDSQDAMGADVKESAIIRMGGRECRSRITCDTLFQSPEIAAIFKSRRFNLALVDLKENMCGLILAKEMQKIPTAVFWGYSFSGDEAVFSPSSSNPWTIPFHGSTMGKAASVIQTVSNLMLYVRDYQAMRDWSQDVDSRLQKLNPETLGIAHHIRDIDLFLVPTSPLLEFPQHVAPNLIHIAGFHFTDDAPPFPKDVLDFMDASKNGTIIVSNDPSSQLDYGPTKQLIRTMSQSPFNFVLTTSPKNPIQDLPRNVFISHDFPSQHLLTHPSVRALITPGGMLSYQEALFHAVPILAMPSAPDQINNAKAVEDKGYGRAIWTEETCAEDMLELIEEVATQIRFRDQIQRCSKLFRKMLVHNPPKVEAVFWLELLMKRGHLNEIKLRTIDFNQIIDFGEWFLIALGLALIATFLWQLRMCQLVGTGTKEKKL